MTKRVKRFSLLPAVFSSSRWIVETPRTSDLGTSRQHYVVLRTLSAYEKVSSGLKSRCRHRRVGIPRIRAKPEGSPGYSTLTTDPFLYDTAALYDMPLVASYRDDLFSLILSTLGPLVVSALKRRAQVSSRSSEPFRFSCGHFDYQPAITTRLCAEDFHDIVLLVCIIALIRRQLYRSLEDHSNSCDNTRHIFVSGIFNAIFYINNIVDKFRTPVNESLWGISPHCCGRFPNRYHVAIESAQGKSYE
jgi:hypothetical protein